MIDAPVFSHYARYYDLLYKDKDYASEADYVHRLIQRHCPGGATILELGSGTGKHAVLLSRAGYRVVGIERSQEMLAQAQALAESVRRELESTERTIPEFALGDIRTAQVDGQFDAVISLFHVVSYQVTNADLLAVFQVAHRHVRPGGLFVFDAWYGPAVLTDRPTVRVKRIADDQIEVTRIAEPVVHPEGNTVDVNYHVFLRDTKTGAVNEIREKHQMRYLFTPELDLFLRTTGFELVESAEWMSGRRPGWDTWGVCFVARRC